MSDRLQNRDRIPLLLVMLATVSICILPMGQLPIWNGENPEHRNQYELMAENLMAGRLYFDYGCEDTLNRLENPYDPAARKEAGVHYHWDHAYYNGRYYMYFGIVPVILLFLPYQLLTGTPLTTYHATQIFTLVFILGMFALFRLLSRRFFRNLPLGIQLALSSAFSIMSVWYASAEPALYCTAITAALALEIWSIYFFIRAVWQETIENRQLLFAALGALLGALAFGCRPPIALANLLVIPMLAVFLRQRKFNLKLLGKLLLAALPYITVAVGLMLYNYARFDTPFEFGQKYQLTVADQSRYGLSLNVSTLIRVFSETTEHLFAFASLTAEFPYLQHGGVFCNFPILLLTACACTAGIRCQLQAHHLTGLLLFLLLTPTLITCMDVLWTPYLLERYHMDIYYLLAIACYITIGCWYETEMLSKERNWLMAGFSAVTLLSAVLFCLRTVSAYYPEIVASIAERLS